MMSEFLIDQAMREAMELQNRNQLDDAKAIYQKIIVHDKNNSDAYHLISLIHLVEGKLDEARNSIISAIELQPDISVYHSNYGNILYQSNNLEFAIQEHKRAIKLDKKNFQSFYSLGVVYTHLKNYEKAIENYKKALSLDSESSVAHNNLANIYNNLNPKDPVALNLFTQKDLIEAIEKAERRIKREKKQKEKMKLTHQVNN